MNRKKGVILSYLMMIFEVLSTLLITPFLIRTLGQAEYGVYKLSASITAYLLLLDLGIGNAIIRYIAKYRANCDRDAEQKFLGIAILFYIAVAVLSVICGIVLLFLFPTVFSKGLSAEEIALGQKLLLITIINVAVTIGTTVYSNVIIAYEKFGVSKGFSILQIILRMIMTVAVLKAGMGSIGVVSVNLILTVLCRGVFVIYVFARLKLRPKFKGVDKRLVGEVFGYSIWILLQMIATQINVSMDQILLGSLVVASSTIIAVYSVGTQIVQYFRSIGSSFTGVLMPGVVRFAERGATGEAICGEMVRIGRIMLIVLGLIWAGFTALGRQFIALWAGSANASAYTVALLLMSVYLFVMVESIGVQILWAKNEQTEMSLLKLGIVLANVLVSVLLIRWNPLIGATVGTVISLFLGDVVVMNILFKKKLRISLRSYYKGLFKGVLLCILLSMGIGMAVNLLPLVGWFGLLIKIGLVCAIYGIMLLLFGFNPYEKQLLLSLLRIKKANHG